ncbi:MAG: selenocysteine-specific translation elongation factor [Armatimonadota bacterium]
MKSDEIEQTIIGTAGHIDHGKTALVRALTGIDCDTLTEEKKRGITIELGFAFMQTPGFDRQIVFIDVPGHEKLIKTMVAGASNINAALLVVAADEGINVQTREHFDILRILGVETGIIAITKADLVDDEHIRLVKSEIESLVAGTFLEGQPIIPVSAITGVGVDEVRSALISVAGKTKKRRDSGIFRMPVDRVFALQGFGAVIAGTVLSGEVNIGDKLEIMPDGLTARVRGIQIHNESRERSYLGRRTAISLQDVKKDQLRRGQVACAPGSLSPTALLDVRLFVSQSYNDELKNRTRVRLHVGTDEVMCRAVLLDTETLVPDETGYAQLVLESPTAALPKDRFVIRSFSSQETIGGGTILDSQPMHHKRFDEAAIKGLKKLEGCISDVVDHAFFKSRFVPKNASEIAFSIGEREAAVGDVIKSLVSVEKLVSVTSGAQEKYLHRDRFDELAAKLINIIKDYYSKDAYKTMMPAADLQSRFLKLADRQVFDAITSELDRKKIFVRRDNKFGLADRESSLSDAEQKAAERIESIFLSAGYSTPLEDDVMDELRLSPKVFKNIMTSLIDQGQLIRLSDKVTYHRDTFEKAKISVVEYIKSNGGITAAELRDILSVSRKYAIALLEYFDSACLTRRDGDKRLLIDFRR